MSRHIGNAGTKAMAWVQHVMLSFNAQAKRTRELEEFRQGLRSVFDPGESLDIATRRRVEAFFGCDLGEVSIHYRQRVKETSHQLGARAFTFRGQDFGSKQNLDTSNEEGLGPLAHELTHVMQQTQSHRLPKGQMTEQNTSLAPAALPRGYSNTEMVLLAPTRSTPVITNPQLGEAQTQASKRLMAKGLGSETKSPPQINHEEVTKKVYCLMQNDVRLEQERAT